MYNANDRIPYVLWVYYITFSVSGVCFYALTHLPEARNSMRLLKEERPKATVRWRQLVIIDYITIEQIEFICSIIFVTI